MAYIINRSAEAMTIFAVLCAAIFVTLHTGRPWLDYMLFHYQINLVHCGLTLTLHCYGTCLRYQLMQLYLLFWYIGLIP